jgi:hypothetical protein
VLPTVTMQMCRRTFVGGVKAGLIAGALALAWSGHAAAQTPATAEPGAKMQARAKLVAMEKMLEAAVQLGAQRVRAQVQAAFPYAPDMLVISGMARARGFWLEGYGVFFDVDVPAMRKSLIWTVQMLEQNDRGLGSELATLKRIAATVDNPAARRELQQTLQRIETQVSPPRASAPPAGSAVAAVSEAGGGRVPAVSPDNAQRAAILEDPGAVYTTEVKDALVDIMVDYGGALPVAPNEWLTVAARDQGVSRLQPGDPYESSTIVVRIKGADLTAFRAGQIDREQTRGRVELREY